MKSPVFPSLALPLLLLALVAGTASTYSQRACRVSPGKRNSAQMSEVVTIQITDETGGKVVTYEKTFRLDHIPVKLRQKYVDNLLDSLTRFEEDENAGWDVRIEESRVTPVPPKDRGAFPGRPAMEAVVRRPGQRPY